MSLLDSCERLLDRVVCGLFENGYPQGRAAGNQEAAIDPSPSKKEPTREDEEPAKEPSKIGVEKPREEKTVEEPIKAIKAESVDAPSTGSNP